MRLLGTRNTPTDLCLMKKEALDKQAKALYDREMVMTIQRRKWACSHPKVNYLTNDIGNLEVWCNRCGDSLPLWMAKRGAPLIPEEPTSSPEPAHDLDVVQRLSEAYRQNKGEIEVKILKSKGTEWYGPK